VNHPASCGPCDDCLDYAEESGYNLARLGGPETTPATIHKIRASRRREEALRLRAEGLVPSAIADRLGVSDKTVRNYLAKLLHSEVGLSIPLSMRSKIPKSGFVVSEYLFNAKGP
jgi:hypothetical protein